MKQIFATNASASARVWIGSASGSCAAVTVPIGLVVVSDMCSTSAVALGEAPGRSATRRTGPKTDPTGHAPSESADLHPAPLDAEMHTS
ncbi:hypothetical protein GCM10020369_22740 [Cryptosporangium minutisporangium]|uniref:Uncharacterized protein n=1 Tax=Cryptosporangium minutisporangium TaxID=113569 RepID=A0ABP6SWI1_9ACTN